MVELDKLDRKILYELDLNSRRQLSQIAKILHIGRDRLKYRIEKLKEQGVIKKFTVTTDPYKIGLTIYKTYLRLENNKPKIKEFITFLRKHPRIYWIAECDGAWDLIFSTFARSPKEFHEIQDSILSQFKTIVMEFNVYTLVDVWFYHKNYLINGSRSHFFFGGYPENNQLEPIDVSILKILSENAQENVVSMAQKLKTTPKIVSYRIKKLEKAKIIVGYRTDIELEKIGMTFFKAQFYLRNFDIELEKQFREYCLQHPNITYYIRQIGDCKLELELEVENYQQFNKIIDDIRTTFFKFIKNVGSLLIKREYFKWIPYDLNVD